MKNGFVYLRMYANDMYALQPIHYEQLEFAENWCLENNINWLHGGIQLIADWDKTPKEDFSFLFDLFEKRESEPDCVVHFEFLEIAEKNRAYEEFTEQLQQLNIEFIPIWVLPFKVHTLH